MAHAEQEGASHPGTGRAGPTGGVWKTVCNPTGPVHLTEL